MRAPPDSMKPTTGRAGAAGEPQHAHDRVGVLLAERAAEVGRVLRVAEDRAAVDAAGAGDDAVAGARLLAHPRASGRRERSSVSEPRSQSASRRSMRTELVRCVSSLDGHGASRHSTALWPPKPNAFESATAGWPLTSSVARLVRDVVEVEPLVGLLVVERRRRDPVAHRQQRRDGLDGAGGAEQVADRPTSASDTGTSLPSTSLIATVSARSLSGVEVPCALT